MAWRIAGSYVSHCDCQQVCGCAWDQPPTGPDNQCRGIIVFQVAEGDLDDTDLSGVKFAAFFFIPEHFSAGFDMGIVVDEGASDEQASALGRIIEGKEGGPFEEFAGIRTNWLGVERDRVTFTDGEEPSAQIGDTAVSFEAFRGEDGKPSTVSNAPFGFAPVFKIGKSSGRSGLFGKDFDANYGEAAEYEFST